jgi:hypothetical protein
MSTLHLRQICNFLEKEYFPHIPLDTDELSKSEEEIYNFRLTRSLVGMSVSMISNENAGEASKYITDGYGDNGIDGIFFNYEEKCLYLIQSKFHKDGNGSIDTGDLLKFIQGIKDLVNTRYEKFNDKINLRSSEIESYLLDAQTKFSLVVVHTGKQPISNHCEALINEFLDEYNDISEIFTFNIFNQRNLHSFISVGAEGNPINIDVLLHNWGDTKEPIRAFYGQIAASDLASWYEENGRQLFSPNIRVYLGETDVNEGIVETIENQPDYFYYFNNGITALCDQITKKPIGGTGHDTGIFECKNLKIVNGAQTVGTIHSLLRKCPENLEKTRVWTRIISLENSEPELSKNITKNNNTQNRIEKRDFVSLDPEQKRIHDELIIENVTYLYKSGELRDDENESFDLVDATVARACVQNEIQLSVQSKREISKLWDDIEKTPYKLLFNAGIQSTNILQEVRVLRIVESFVTQQKRIVRERDKLMITHGNRFLLHLVYKHLQNKIYDESETTEEKILPICSSLFDQLKDKVNNLYPDSVLGSLFKNLSKCRHIEQEL